MKKLIFGLLTLTIISNLAIPAEADEVNLQNTRRIMIQVGDNNRSYRRSGQTIRPTRDRYRDNDTNGTRRRSNGRDRWRDRRLQERRIRERGIRDYDRRDGGRRNNGRVSDFPEFERHEFERRERGR